VLLPEESAHALNGSQMAELKKLIEEQKEEVEAGETTHPSVLPDLLLRLGGEVSSDLSY
jgi:hypothetical protein